MILVKQKQDSITAAVCSNLLNIKSTQSFVSFSLRHALFCAIIFNPKPRRPITWLGFLNPLWDTMYHYFIVKGPSSFQFSLILGEKTIWKELAVNPGHLTHQATGQTFRPWLLVLPFILRSHGTEHQTPQSNA